MPSKAPSPCGQHGCGQLATYRGRCEQHQWAPWRNPSKHHGVYADRRWRRLKASVLREHPHCEHCGQAAAEVDHIIPLADGGAEYDWTNCRALCSSCHKRVTAEQNRARRKRNARGRASEQTA